MAGVDFLILETFFHLEEMKIGLECARASGLPIVATMSFRPKLTESSDGHSAAECARVMAGEGAALVGANCEQEPARMLRDHAAYARGSEQFPLPHSPRPSARPTRLPCFTRMSAFPDALETIQVDRREFLAFGKAARAEGIGFLGGCCGCNAAYIRSLAAGLATA